MSSPPRLSQWRARKPDDGVEPNSGSSGGDARTEPRKAVCCDDLSAAGVHNGGSSGDDGGGGYSARGGRGARGGGGKVRER